MTKTRCALQGADGKWHAVVDVPIGAMPEMVVWNRGVYKLAPDVEPPTGYNGPVYRQAFAWWSD